VQDQTNKVRVLVADSSSYTRLVLEEIIAAEKDITVTGVASDGDELVQLLKLSGASVVMADYGLPKNNRFFTFKRIFSEVPTPIVLLLEKELLTLELVKEVTALGVYAIILKPEGALFPNYRSIAAEVLMKVRAVQQTDFCDMQRRLLLLQQEVADMPKRKPKQKVAPVETVIVIGASTGGTQAIEYIIRHLSPDLQASILIAVHLPVAFTRTFTRRLQELTPLTVKEGRSGLLLQPGKIIVAPGERNMVVKPVMGNRASLKIDFEEEETVSFDLPSVDVLMESVAQSAVKRIVGVILTGMGKDGTVGAGLIKGRGGVVIAQNEASSAIFGMAKSAIDSGFIKEVLPLGEIAQYINNLEQHGVSITDSIT
jgi:two-component system chemotaxis response regulator CheB